MTTARHVEVAQTIMAQIGRGNVNALKVMTGAKNFMSHNEECGALSFRIPMKTRNGANYMKVTLNASDTYTVEFGRVWGHKYVQLAGGASDVYAEDLAGLFERETGLFVSF